MKCKSRTTYTEIDPHASKTHKSTLLYSAKIISSKDSLPFPEINCVKTLRWHVIEYQAIFWLEEFD